MFYSFLKSPRLAVSILLFLGLLLTVSCGGAAQPAAKPTTAPAATVAPAAVAQPATAPSGAAVAGAKVAPSFADYWKPPTAFYGRPVKGGTLRVIYEDPLEHGNSWGASTGSATRFRAATMNSVISLDPYDSTKLIPDLAKGWTVEDDATGVTFFFHDNIKWHNGQPFTCEDARFTLQTWITGEGITASSLKANFGFVDLAKTSCVDDLTMKVGFKGPSAVWSPAFAAPIGFIFNKAWFQAGGEKAMFNDISVGTGPFMWGPGQKVGIDEQHFVKNPKYFKGNGALPYLDEVVIFGIEDESRQQASMLAHQGDWHWVRNFGQYRAYVDHDQIMTVIRATRGHHSFWINRRNPPFNNVKVRQAIIMGLDRTAAIKVLQEGFGSEGFLMVPGSAWELSREKGCAVPGWCVVKDMEAQRAAAKKILQAEGFDFNKTYLFTVESDAQVQARATFVQEQLRLLGIKTDFDLVETVAYRKKTTTGAWGDFVPRNDTMRTDDPFVGMGQYMSSKSLSNNHWMPAATIDDVQAKMDALLEKSSITIDPVARKANSDEIQLLGMQQYWKFPLYWEQEAVAFWPEIRGYYHYPAPTGPQVKWEQIWYDPAHKNDKGNKGQTKGVPGGL